MFNQQGSFCDVAIGMTNDDNAKLVYIGKKHFNFGRNGNWFFGCYSYRKIKGDCRVK